MEVEQLMWQEGWTPTTDLEVSLLMKVLQDKEKECQKIFDSANEEIEYLKKRQDDAISKAQSYERKINQLLSNYVLHEVDEDDRKETKTQIKYSLARGTIVINKPTTKIEKPTDEALVAQQFPEYVQQIPKLQWNEIKKNLEVNDEGEVIDKRTGKTVNGITTTSTEQSISLKLN